MCGVKEIIESNIPIERIAMYKQEAEAVYEREKTLKSHQTM